MGSQSARLPLIPLPLSPTPQGRFWTLLSYTTPLPAPQRCFRGKWNEPRQVIWEELP